MSEFVLEGGGETTIVKSADSRPQDIRELAATVHLNGIVLKLREIHKIEALLRKMEAWLDAHDESHPKYHERDRRYESVVMINIDLISHLEVLAQRLHDELVGWTHKDRDQFVRSLMIPWPCTFDTRLYDASLDTTPWKEYPAF